MHLLMLVTTFCWASNIIAGKAALRGFSPLALAQLRLAGAAITFGILWLAWRPALRPRLKAGSWAFLAWVALFGTTLNQLLFIGGLSRTSAANTSLIVALGPVMVLALSCLMRLEALTVLKLAGMAISFAGVGILTLAKAGEGSGATVAGDAIQIAGSGVFAYYTVLLKEIVDRFDALTLNAVVFGMGALMMVPFSLHSMIDVRWAAAPAVAWGGLAFMVFCGSVAAYLIYAFALTELTAARVAAFAYLQPAIATALAIWLLGEFLTGRVVVGGALILLGVYLTERERGEQKDTQPARNEVQF